MFVVGNPTHEIFPFFNSFSISLNGQLSDLYVLKQNNVLHNFKKFKSKSINEYQWNYYGFSRVNSFWYFISIFLPHIVSKPYSKFFLVQISSKAKIKYMLKMSQKCDCDKTKQTKKPTKQPNKNNWEENIQENISINIFFNIM